MRLSRALRQAVALILVAVLCVGPALLATPAAAQESHAAQESAAQESAAQEHGGAAEGEEGAEGEEPFSALEHTIDAAYLDFPPFGVVELPRLFVLKKADGSWGLDGYWNTRNALESGRYGLRHETDEGSEMVSDPATLDEMIAHHEHLHAHVAALGGASIAVDLSATKHLFYALLAIALMLVTFIGLAHRYRRGVGRETAPRGLVHNILEAMVVFVRDDIAKPSLGAQYKRFLPFLLTSFFFILIGNLFALIPYTSAPTANISVTLALALFTFIIGQVYASKAHWQELFTGPPGVPVFVRILMVPIEIIGLLVRHLALAIRLFANMMAGTLVVFSLIGLIFLFNTLFGSVAAWASTPISVGFTLFILVIKLLVAFIQAYVFTMLSAIFIGMAVEEHHGVEEERPEELKHDTGVLTPTVSGDGTAEQRTRVEVEGAEQPTPVAANG